MRPVMKRGTVWLIAILGVAVLWGAAVATKARPIERRIATQVVDELKRLGLDRRVDALAIEISGRDVTLAGTALSEEDRARALAAVTVMPGVDRIHDRIVVAPVAKPF